MAALAVAHRAGNSLAGLRDATDLGVDVVECDVHEYRSRLEVRHLKTAGPLPVLWDRWELTAASGPRLELDAVLEAERRDAVLMLDLKGRRASLARSVTSVLREHGDRGPVLVCGRWWPAVDAVSEIPFVEPVLSARTRDELLQLFRRLETGPPVTGVSVHRSLLRAPVVSQLRRHVDLVLTWPVNDVASLDILLQLGVTGIISDELPVLTELLERRHRAE
jgi:glycerophosphoryl diester phosphodiesterase